MSSKTHQPPSINPYENRSEKPLAPSTQVDQERSPAGDRGDGGQRHREQSEEVAGTPDGVSHKSPSDGR